MKVGVDIDSWKLTACALGNGQPQFAQASLRQRGHGLFDAIQRVTFALGSMLDGFGPVTEIHVERGRGMFRSADFELGAIYGATIIAARRVHPNAYLGTVTVQEWKKAVTAAVGITTGKGVPGNANATKEIANEACRKLLQVDGVTSEQAWALSADELDAFGIVYSTLTR